MIANSTPTNLELPKWRVVLNVGDCAIIQIEGEESCRCLESPPAVTNWKGRVRPSGCSSRTLDSQTPGSRTAVHVLMGEKRKKCLERRNLTESTIVRRSIDLPVLFESCKGSARTRP
ncbi:hypothetical protein TNCV_941261 [Trichonephila clavipes]|nr:hypothetical protein TNCV_941261 [Trichonephila clavipes]